MIKPTIKNVENFWSKNPLFTGEEEYDPAHPNKFFKSHDEVYFNDVLWGINIESVFYLPNKKNITIDIKPVRFSKLGMAAKITHIHQGKEHLRAYLFEAHKRQNANLYESTNSL